MGCHDLTSPIWLLHGVQAVGSWLDQSNMSFLVGSRTSCSRPWSRIMLRKVWRHCWKLSALELSSSSANLESWQWKLNHLCHTSLKNVKHNHYIRIATNGTVLRQVKLAVSQLFICLDVNTLALCVEPLATCFTCHPSTTLAHVSLSSATLIQGVAGHTSSLRTS